MVSGVDEIQRCGGELEERREGKLCLVCKINAKNN